MLDSPISYYGGKKNLIKEILPLIPEHKQYVEPFVGGASVFFAKEKSELEVINDYDLRVVNFWEVLKTDFESLEFKIKKTLHHEYTHRTARDILKDGLKDNVLDFAWAFWVQTNMSFSHAIFAGFAFGNHGDRQKSYANKKGNFSDVFYYRIKDVQIFNRDAIDLIKLKDNEDVFMYFDPPYAEGYCQHYEHKKEVYYRLLDLLPTLKCKWLMSSYPSEQLTQIREENGYNYKDISQNLSVDATRLVSKRKTECLTWNYELSSSQLKMF